VSHSEIGEPRVCRFPKWHVWTRPCVSPKIPEMRIDRELPGWSNLRRGATLIGIGVTLCLTIFLMDEARLAIESGATLMLVAQEAGDLRPGADVWLAGVQAGVVTEIRFLEDAPHESPHLAIRAVLSREAARALRRDAGATIQPSGLLAPFVVDLTAGRGGQPPYDFADTLRAEISVTTRAIVALGDSLRRVLKELQPIVDRLKRDVRAGGGTLAELTTRPAPFFALREDLARLRSLTSHPGSLERLARDTALVAALRRSSDRLEMVAERSVSGRDSRERVRRSLRSLSENVDALGRRLAAARGTAGRAAHDTELDLQLHLLRARLDTVKSELARNPLAWLRFRLF